MDAVVYWSKTPGRLIDQTTGGPLPQIAPDFTLEEWNETLHIAVVALKTLLLSEAQKRWGCQPSGGSCDAYASPDVTKLLSMLSGWRVVTHQQDDDDAPVGLKGKERVHSVKRIGEFDEFTVSSDSVLADATLRLVLTFKVNQILYGELRVRD